MLRLLLPFLAFASLNAQLVVDTYAGGAIPSGVQAQNVGLGTIPGVAWDLSGNIVFSDTTYNVIRRVRSDGVIETVAGTGVTGFSGDGGPATAALINTPGSLAYDASGNLYFFDSGNYRIRRIDAKGVITSIAGDGQARVAGQDTDGPAIMRALSGPLTLAADGAGNVYIAEQDESRILRATTAGNLETIAQVDRPTGVAVDGAGTVYVASALGSLGPFGSVYRISPNGVITSFITFTGRVPNFMGPLVTDAAGNVYVVLNGRLTRYAPDGTSVDISTPGTVYANRATGFYYKYVS